MARKNKPTPQARKLHKKVDRRFKGNVRKNNKMKIKTGPNSPKRRGRRGNR